MFLAKNVISFRDFFFIKLSNRYPAFTENTLHKESINCLLMIFSGYYATFIAALLIILHKIRLITPVRPDNELFTRVVVGVLLIGPIFLIRKYMILKLSVIAVDKNQIDQKDTFKRIIGVCLFGYALIFIALPSLNYILAFLN